MPGLDVLLREVSTIVVTSCGEKSAEIEVRGVRGLVQSGEFGLCVGTEVVGEVPEVATDSINRWLQRATLLLAASRATADYSLSCDDSRWLLWRWYASGQPALPAHQVREMMRQLDGQVALRGYLLRLLRQDTRPPRPLSSADLPG